MAQCCEMEGEEREEREGKDGRRRREGGTGLFGILLLIVITRCLVVMLLDVSSGDRGC